MNSHIIGRIKAVVEGFMTSYFFILEPAFWYLNVNCLKVMTVKSRLKRPHKAQIVVS